MEYGISFHLFHPPLTNTKSAEKLPIPKEFKADAKKVGYGLANRIWSDKMLKILGIQKPRAVWPKTLVNKKDN